MSAIAKEKALLAGLNLPGSSHLAHESMQELRRLAETAGADVQETCLQNRKAPDAATYFGIGKVEEIKALAESLDCQLILVDDELRPSQQRNLEEATGRVVLDRTQVILDIFAQRARTGEGKLQVEWAQLSYLLPRLVGMNRALSRLGGGIGARGPGETKLETDRRRIRDRMAGLRREIDGISKMRGMHRETRKKTRAYTAALAGYTNAGKSSLFNTMTQSQAYVQDQLFATLDPTLRPIPAPRAQAVPLLLFDTVGFIRKLPHSLVAAFRATLEEIVEADLIVRLLDASSEDYLEQMATVDGVLEEILKAQGLPPLDQHEALLVFNKIDLLSRAKLAELKAAWPQALFVSAKDGKGVQALVEEIQERSHRGFRIQHYLLPPDKAGLLAKYFDVLAVQKQRWGSRGVTIEAILKGPIPEMDPYKTDNK